MQIVRYFLLLVTMITLAACASTGGAPEDLPPASGAINGVIKGDYYFAPNKAFSVMVPHPPSKGGDDMYEWMHTQIREIQTEHTVGILFGPAALDRNDYHIILTTHPMRGDHERYTRQLFEDRLAQRDSKYEERMFETDLVGDKTRYYAVYENDKRYLILSATDNTDNFYTIESDIPKESLPEGLTLDTLTKKEWKIFNRLQESFQAPAMPMPAKKVIP